MPSPVNPPSGCRFHTRCWLYERLGTAGDVPHGRPGRCEVLEGDQSAACHFAEEALKTDVGIAHLLDERVRRGTPASALASLQGDAPVEPALEAPAARPGGWIAGRDRGDAGPEMPEGFGYTTT